MILLVGRSIMGLRLDRKLSADVIKLAYPIILGMVFQTAVNLADTIMVGWMDDETVSVAGVAAIGITLPLYWLVGGFLSAIAVGTQALTARRFGEKKFEKSGRVLFNSLSVAISLGVILSVAGALLIPYVFPFFNSNPDVLREGIPYAQMRFLAVMSMVTTISYKAFFDGIGKTYIHMVASIVMNVTNIGLNALLIFGLWGFPELGVFGAGLGSLIASYLGLLIIAGWSFGPNLMIKYQYYRRKNFNPGVIGEITRLSVPGGLATVFVMTGFLLFLKIVGMIDHQEWMASFPVRSIDHLQAIFNSGLADGSSSDLMKMLFAVMPEVDRMTTNIRPPVYTAGTKVILDLMSLSFMTAIALGTATSTFVSQNLGRGDAKLAERYGWEAVKIGVYLLGSIGLLEALFPQFFLNLFTNKLVVIMAAENSMRMVGAMNFMIGAGLIFMNALFGAGNSKFVMFAEMGLHFGCLVPLAYLFGVYLDLRMEGVWLAGCTYILLLGTILGWKFRQGEWKYIKI